MIIATGAVEPTEDNLTAWFKSGVTAVGMGSKLFPKEAVEKGDWAAIADLCRKALSYIRKAKG
jgi:2-dehydro-3-deoxyphosphogluconate aldolase/(4S)-4-hydroxy-2-oxoglutarate aldolase